MALVREAEDTSRLRAAVCGDETGELRESTAYGEGHQSAARKGNVATDGKQWRGRDTQPRRGGARASGGADAWVTRAWLRAAGVDSNLYGACFEAAGGVRVASLLELHRSHGLDEALMALGVTPLGTRRLLAAALERLEPHQGLPTSGGIGSGERDGQRKGSDRDGGLRKRARPDRSAQRTMTSLRPRSTPAPTPNTTPRRADESLGASLTAFVHQQVAKTEAVHLDSDFESTPTPTADAPATTTASASPTRPGTAASWPIAWKPASPHQPPPVAPMASTRTRRPTRPYTRPQRHAPSHCIAGAPGCVVDSFRVPCRDGDGWRHFFLTHFHADHYGGLSRRHFTPESGRRVYCSAITANCVQAELRLHESVLVRVPVGDARGLVIFEDGSCSCCPTTATATEVDTEKISSSSKDAAARPLLRVMACDANHCPGAVMFIFYVVATRSVAAVTGRGAIATAARTSSPHRYDVRRPAIRFCAASGRAAGVGGHGTAGCRPRPDALSLRHVLDRQGAGVVGTSRRAAHQSVCVARVATQTAAVAGVSDGGRGGRVGVRAVAHRGRRRRANPPRAHGRHRLESVASSVSATTRTGERVCAGGGRAGDRLVSFGGVGGDIGRSGHASAGAACVPAFAAHRQASGHVHPVPVAV
eukprot:ctg_1908.g350